MEAATPTAGRQLHGARLRVAVIGNLRRDLPPRPGQHLVHVSVRLPASPREQNADCQHLQHVQRATLKWPTAGESLLAPANMLAGRDIGRRRTSSIRRENLQNRWERRRESAEPLAPKSLPARSDGPCWTLQGEKNFHKSAKFSLTRWSNNHTLMPSFQ
jgi:hypothetical protein